MKRALRSGRRTWVYLDGASCVIWGQRKGRSGSWDVWAPEHRCYAYEVNCYRKLPDTGRKLDRDGAFTRETQLALTIDQLVTGDVAYAFYSRESHAVKIGRTTNLPQRWAKLEHESGQVRQLLSVWRSPHGSRDLERELHQRWIEHRVFGEWFAADPVLTDLQQSCRSRSA